MIKFSKILKESIDIEELEDYFLLISDTLNETPDKKVMGKGDFIMYQFTWKLNFNISEYNPIDSLDKISKCFECITELKTSQRRILDYDIEFKINDELCVKLTPKNKTDDLYKFIIGEHLRAISISYTNIVKFFKNNKYRVLSIDEIDDDYGSQSRLEIHTDADDDVCREFVRIFNLEFDMSDISKNVSICSYNYNGYVSIYPEDEKTYITLIYK